MTDMQSSIEWVKLSLIMTDHRVNTRQIEQHWVDKKVNEGVDPDKIGVPTVSKRSEKMYVWLDGQHRGALLRAVGYGEQTVQVKVFHGLTIPEEAILFLGLNDGRTVSSFAKFKARVSAEEPTANAIKDIVEKHGWKIDFGTRDRVIAATAALDAAYARGAEVLERTMQIITAAWGHDATASEGALIRGIAIVVAWHGDDLNDPRLAKRLRTNTPEWFLAQSRGRRAAIGGSVFQSVATFAIDTYNKSLKAEHKLSGGLQT